eukprot:Blabericola_migrator_1__7243@NODE_367_length_9377_cov_157_637487_g294_i0_p5_GENE_NODE_367_length_9377_cov_157_637487_g294_i0NODE_367_length_9377_cov_157_637487_g294_i0_p5_ORF_typecomplete_len315_score41_23PAPS_reduct/PF01507_19/9_6e26_NODE_367_length_9377_cov_157_637487_g294_i08131757
MLHIFFLLNTVLIITQGASPFLLMTPTTSVWAESAFRSALSKYEAYSAFMTREERRMDTLRQLSIQSTEAGSQLQSDSFSEEGKPSLHLTGSSLRKSLEVLKSALRLYGSQGVIAAFNGGKDATIVLDLMCAVLAHHYQLHTALPRIKPRAVYFLQRAEEFNDLVDFVEERRVIYDLDLTICHGPIQDCIKPYMDSIDPDRRKSGSEDWVRHPAFILGVRLGDPRSEGLNAFEPSSDWVNEAFMRVHPILDWTYGMVWDYFETFKVSYCNLYDQGYTSLGKAKETSPNQHLVHVGSKRARDLEDWTAERNGRGA